MKIKFLNFFAKKNFTFFFKNITDKKLTQPIEKKIYYYALISAVLFFILYFLTQAKAHIGFLDSDKFLLIASNLGVFKAPGFSIQTLLTYFWINLPLPFPLIVKAHLLSALLQSLSIFFVFLTLYRLVQCLQKQIKDKFISFKIDPLLIAFLGSVFLATAYYFWYSALFINIYIFNSFLLALVLFLSVIMLTSDSKLIKKEFWIILGFSLILFITNLINFALAMLLLLVLIFFLDKKNFQSLSLLALSLFITFCLQIVLLWFLQKNNVDFSYRFVNSFWAALTFYLQGIFNLQIFVRQISLAFFSNIYLRYFSIFELLLLVLAFFTLIKWDKKISLFFFAPSFVVGFLFLFFVNNLQEIEQQLNFIPLFLPIYILLIFPLALFFYSFLEKSKKIILVIGGKEKLALIFPLALLSLFIFVRMFINLHQIRVNQFILSEKLSQKVLQDLPADSLLICFEEKICDSILYEQVVNKVRKDVVTLIPSELDLNQNIAKKNLHGFSYEDSFFKVLDYLTYNIGKRPVFVLGLTNDYINILGFDYSFVYYIPYGYVAQLYHQLPQNLPPTNYSLSEDFYDIKISKNDLYQEWYKYFLAQNHALNASFYSKMGYRDLVRDELNIAANLLYQIEDVNKKNVESMRNQIEGGNKIGNYEPGSSSQTIEEILKNVDNYLTQGKIAKAYIGALGATIVDPMSSEARLKLASIYEKLGDKKMALTEYKNILLYYPESTISAQKVSELQK